MKHLLMCTVVGFFLKKNLLKKKKRHQMLKRTSWLLEQSQDRLEGGKKTKYLNKRGPEYVWPCSNSQEGWRSQGVLMQMFLCGLQERIRG